MKSIGKEKVTIKNSADYLRLFGTEKHDKALQIALAFSREVLGWKDAKIDNGTIAECGCILNPFCLNDVIKWLNSSIRFINADLVIATHGSSACIEVSKNRSEIYTSKSDLLPSLALMKAALMAYRSPLFAGLEIKNAAK